MREREKMGEGRLVTCLAKDGVLPVEEFAGIEGDEELTAVAVGCILVCAGDEAPVAEPEPRVKLIFKRLPIVDGVVPWRERMGIRDELLAGQEPKEARRQGRKDEQGRAGATAQMSVRKERTKGAGGRSEETEGTGEKEETKGRQTKGSDEKPEEMGQEGGGVRGQGSR